VRLFGDDGVNEFETKILEHSTINHFNKKSLKLENFKDLETIKNARHLKYTRQIQ
jgi:hypothetical protein